MLNVMELQLNLHFAFSFLVPFCCLLMLVAIFLILFSSDFEIS